MLNNIRSGNGKAAIQELLQQCSRPLPEQNGVKPTQLFSRNADVDTVNAEELRALQGEEVRCIPDFVFLNCFQCIDGLSPALCNCLCDLQCWNVHPGGSLRQAAFCCLTDAATSPKSCRLSIFTLVCIDAASLPA